MLKSIMSWLLWTASIGTLLTGHYLGNDGLVSLGVTLTIVVVVIRFLLVLAGMAGLVMALVLDKGDTLKDVELPKQWRMVLGILVALFTTVVLAYLGHTVLAVFYILSVVFSWAFIACLFGLAKRNEEDNL